MQLIRLLHLLVTPSPSNLKIINKINSTRCVVFKRFMTSEERKKFKTPYRYRAGKSSIWIDFNKLGAETNPLNLGQGFPDFAPPEHVTKGLAEVATSDNCLLHQYTRGYGHPRLVKAIANLYTKITGHNIDPNSEVLTTSGAYEALFSTIHGHGQEGDEIIIIEPFFDCYAPMVVMCGATPKFIPLRFIGDKKAKTLNSNDFVLNQCELEGLFTKKTKAIIVNTPNNPYGKVFSMKEMTMIANLCKKWNVLCISDEVYEWMLFEPSKHIRMATLPDMWERTITIGSAGKCFSVTGWKVGWAYGPANLIHNLRIAHQNCVNICATPMQEAIAMAFEKETKLMETDKENCFFFTLAKLLQKKRDFMVKALTDSGMKPVIPQGGYFIIADWTPLESKADLSTEKDEFKDFRMAKWMTKNIGLLGIPPTAFFGQNKKLAENYIRYCFIKEDKKLEKAAEILKKFKK